MWLAAVILIVAYAGIAFNRLPGVNIDRTSAAFIGAVLMILLGVLTFEEAIEAIDFNTIALLLGMMILVCALKVSGFFNLLVLKSVALAGTPWHLLLLVIIATAVSSAFLVNDAVVLLFTPIVIQTCRNRKVNPVPYLIAEAMASNIGSTATIVGNPQNMLIGIASGISFTRFFLYCLPITIVSTVVLILVMRRFYGKTFSGTFAADHSPPEKGPHYDAAVVRRLVPIVGLVVIAFFLSSFLDMRIPLIALGCGAVVLLVGRAKPADILKEVDWNLLLFFAGLFIIIGGAHSAGLLDKFTARIIVSSDLSGIASISIVSTMISQLVSNVPLTMLVIPIIQYVPGDALWVALAASSTLGGNLTIIGAVANIIVVEGARREGIHIGFAEFLKVGAIVAGITVAAAILMLGGEYWIGWLK